jgi:DNA-binding transcriptional ArsR family regulator
MNKTKQSAVLDKLFSSLGDSTRRKILQKVKTKPHNINKLAAAFNISLPAVSKHIKILSEAGLIKKEKAGRFIYCSYNFETLKPAMNWISGQHNLWDRSFDKLEEFLKQSQEKSY